MRIRRIIRLTILSLILLSCNTSKRSSVAVVDSLSKVSVEPNILDSLRLTPECGELQSRNFVGLLPAASCPGIEYDLALYNQQYSGDGVYKLTQRYIQAENGADKTFVTYGRQYTLRGDATNINAVVYQLVPFDNPKDVVNLLYINDNLELLNKDFERAKSNLNYTLELVK